ncbi:MAG: hypothetical protein PHQ34_06580 [Methanothrix sp.]|nr:hypothetical protein [Methanothrix sp.]
MKSMRIGAKMAPLGKLLLFCCITLGILTALSVAADQKKDVCTGAEMGDYAKLVFCLPPEVTVEPETMAESNYTGGREVGASMLLDGKRVELHLLYPCHAPQKELDPAELKPYLEAFDSVMTQTVYNESETGPALLGRLGNRNVIAYQPNNATVALITTDVNMSASLMSSFLGNLSISVNEGITPPGNCPGSEQVEADTTVDTTEAATTTAVQENPAINPAVKEKMTAAEKMKADRERIQAAMNAARKKL